jgi:hypothetical protein
MKQFTFEAHHRTRNNIERIRATARTSEIARWHIVNYYGDQFDIADLHCNIDPPHRILGEIDCTDAGCEKIAQGVAQ